MESRCGRAARALAVGALAAILTGCPDDTATPGDAGADLGPYDGGPPTYENVQAIFTESCARFSACHNGRGGAGMLLLEDGVSCDELVNRPAGQVRRLRRVAPGDPDNSYLMIKLDGTMNRLPECQAGDNRCGESMPQRGELLHPNVRNAVREWIRMGAPCPRDG